MNFLMLADVDVSLKQHVIGAYIVALGLIWGYAALLWIGYMRRNKR